MSWFRQFSRNTVQIALVILALLVGLRLALPHFVKKYVNKKLDEMPEYDGRIGDVDMHLWRGAYSIQGVEIIKTDGDVPVPFFSSKRVTFSVEWKALFNGALVGEIDFYSPVINFVQGPSRKTRQVGVDKPWLHVIKELFPLNINRFAVHDGTVHYRDFHSRPKVDLKMDQIEMVGTNLTNSEKLSKSLVADIKMTGRAFESAPVEAKVKLDPSTRRATFDLAARMRAVALSRLNEFAEAYGNFSFEKGTFSVTSELAASDGKLTGYIKPLFDDIAVIDLSDAKDNPLKLVWESIVAGVSRLLRNQPKNRFATKIPISGTLSDPKVDVLSTLGNILKNEFVRAFTNEFEGSIEPADAEKERSR
ncbi:MAG: DUF748 domain-containing protein [Terrimicrobiaceae bacterium]